MAEQRFRFGRILHVLAVAYGAETWRRIGRSTVAVPMAARAVVRAACRRPTSLRAVARALVAVPVAISASVLTALLGFVILINEVAYPFRGYLGLPGRTGDIWASEYYDSWGGPTLAGAWAVHAVLGLIVIIPAIALAVRGLVGVQHRLTRAAPASSAADARVQPVETVPAPPVARLRRAAPTGRKPSGLRRVLVAAAALTLFVGLSLAAHAMGIGDNIVWAPRDLASTVALAVTLAPLAGLLVIGRTQWWHRPS